jgi:hypothetical protein
MDVNGSAVCDEPVIGGGPPPPAAARRGAGGFFGIERMSKRTIAAADGGVVVMVAMIIRTARGKQMTTSWGCLTISRKAFADQWATLGLFDTASA